MQGLGFGVEGLRFRDVIGLYTDFFNLGLIHGNMGLYKWRYGGLYVGVKERRIKSRRTLRIWQFP